MTNNKILEAAASRIPAGMRRVIINEGFIDKVANTAAVNTPMEFLFDIYVEYIDPTQQTNWMCPKCRNKIIEDFKKLQPYIIMLVNGRKPEHI